MQALRFLILAGLSALICTSCSYQATQSSGSSPIKKIRGFSIVKPNTKGPNSSSLIAGKYRVVSTQHGKMSWYSVKTNFGTKTASGQKFTNHGHTAAHKTLKMGTRVRVTNLVNGKSVILRINDRGPYKPGRVIDVAVGMSYSDQLDFYNRGVVRCKVEVLEKVSQG